MSRSINICLTVILVILVSFSFPAEHHGWSNYDQTKVLNFTGEILNLSYENPHGIIKLKVDQDEWTVVLAPPNRMKNRNLTEEMLRKGTTATVVGYPHKKVKDEMRAERITIENNTIELR